MIHDVKLKKVGKNDYSLLYELLKERDPNANISYKKLPSYKEHVKFVSSKQYAVWYIIYSDGKKSGTIYLSKQDEIGIFLKKGIIGKGIGSQALTLLMEKNPRKRFLANVSPKNKKSMNFFKKHKFKLIQYTYEFIEEK